MNPRTSPSPSPISAIPWPLRPVVKAPPPGHWGVGGAADGAPAPEAESDWPLWKTALITGGVLLVCGYWLAPVFLVSLSSRLAHEREAVTW